MSQGTHTQVRLHWVPEWAPLVEAVYSSFGILRRVPEAVGNKNVPKTEGNSSLHTTVDHFLLIPFFQEYTQATTTRKRIAPQQVFGISLR